MQNGTARSNGRKKPALSAADVFGMFEAGLAELSAHFHFDAANVDGGVRLTISGLQRVDEDAGAWHLELIEAAEGASE